MMEENMFKNNKDARDGLCRYIEAVREYNASCGGTVSDDTDDTEVVIAE